MSSSAPHCHGPAPERCERSNGAAAQSALHSTNGRVPMQGTQQITLEPGRDENSMRQLPADQKKPSA